MSMTPLRDNVALAIDGGGIKGVIVSTALESLEAELGGGALINNPKLKILAGTSTGSVIIAGIALGMTAAEIADLYKQLGTEVFPALYPSWFPKQLADLDEIRRILTEHSLYTNKRTIELLKQIIQDKTGNADLTLGELHQRIGPEKVLIMTSVNINERKTHFLKTYKDDYKSWKLWEAIMASSSAPLALPVLEHIENDGTVGYYTDGGVGNYGNPAYFATQEALVFRGYTPETTSVLSFGTGWVSAENYQKANGIPSSWAAYLWAFNAPNLFIGDTSRAQSIDIMESYYNLKIDFRRFQFALETDIPADAYGDPATYALMVKIGQTLGARIVADQFAPNEDAQYDPEGLLQTYRDYVKAQDLAKKSK
jgi:patatin-like phospholipase/acyl hydrolase